MARKEKFLIRTCSANAALEDLLAEITRINGDKKSVVQIFDPKRIINRTHIAGAYIDALESFNGKTNISKSMGLEMLLYAAMTNQINEAIKIAGVKNARNFVLFANSRATFNRVRHFLKSDKEFDQDKSTQQKIARKFGIRSGDDMNKFILQRMAISRLGE